MENKVLILYKTMILSYLDAALNDHLLIDSEKLGREHVGHVEESACTSQTNEPGRAVAQGEQVVQHVTAQRDLGHLRI